MFPNQGITVFPKRGSLLFWHNLNKNGQIAEESFHGACPTLYGIKWGKILHKFLINQTFRVFLQSKQVEDMRGKVLFIKILYRSKSF